MEVILFIVGRFYVLRDEDCKFRLTSVWIGFFQDLVGYRIIFFADGSFGFLPHFAEGQTLLTSWFLLGFRTVERVVGNLVAIDITSTPRRSVSSTCQIIMLIWYAWVLTFLSFHYLFSSPVRPQCVAVPCCSSSSIPGGYRIFFARSSAWENGSWVFRLIPNRFRSGQ